MKYAFLTVLMLFCAQPALAGQQDKPAPAQVLSPMTEAVAPIDCVKTYDGILANDATNLTALNGRGMCKNLSKEGSGDADIKKAIELATAKIEADNTNAGAYYSRATSYRVLKDYKNAREDFMRAVDLNPQDQLWAGDLKTLTMEMELQAQIEAQKPEAIEKQP